MQQVYDKKFFKDFYSAIPDEEWNEGAQDKEIEGRITHCALGLLKEEGKNHACTSNSAMANALENLLFHNGIKSIYNNKSRVGGNIVSVNNGLHPRYSQPTSKQRILAAIEDCTDLSIT